MSFLQLPSWGKFQQALGRAVIQRSADDKSWNYQAILERGSGNTRLYTPYGPNATDTPSLSAAIQALETDAKARNATFIRIEPTLDISPEFLKSRGFQPVTFNQLQPAHTQLIDLTIPADQLVANMSQNSRNLYRNHLKRGVSIRSSYNPDDIEIFLDFIHKVAERNHITPHSDEYFRTQAQTLMTDKAAIMYIAEHESRPIAAALLYDSPTTRTYAHAAADDTYRKLSAGTALLAHAIIDAKTAGKSLFDLYGIAPADQPNHPWSGFTKFKKSFGGYEHDYVGAWDKPLKPLAYWFYRTYQSLKKRG